ncbi:MAG: hypothetical protein ACK6A5_15840, partial [Flavobacteriales bacterium]
MAKTLSKPTTAKLSLNGNGHVAPSAAEGRLPVMKTYKIFIGGKFPRTESGRYYQPKGSDGKPLANVCRSSRKDVRDAVVAARGAVSGWAGRSAFNRGPSLYRRGARRDGRGAPCVRERRVLGGTRAGGGGAGG